MVYTRRFHFSFLVGVLVLVGGGGILWAHYNRQRVLLASYSTSLRGRQPQQLDNIQQAVKSLELVSLPPGATFSFNQVVGPRSQEQDYVAAPAITEDEVVPTLGGGVCQVASTLYNAALLANLAIVERHAHSRAIRSAPPGFDATVVYGTKDLRFRNPFPQTVWFHTGMVGDRLVVQVYARRSPRIQVKVYTESKELPSERRSQPDPSLPPGKQVIEKGSSGVQVRVLRQVTEPRGGGRLEVISADTYPSQPTIVRFGTRKTSPASEK